MKGDFTRDSFHLAKNFSGVFMQQGRVTLDSDFNEQAAITRHQLRAALRDIIGPYAGPAGPQGGFRLAVDNRANLTIGKGHYYVDGILVENASENCTYTTQPDFQVPSNDDLLSALSGKASDNQAFWIYLDVWERHISSLEDDTIREAALGGPDTSTRAKVTWQIKALALTLQLAQDIQAAQQKYNERIDTLWSEKAELEKKFEGANDTATQVSTLKQLLPVDEALSQLTRFSQLPVHQTLLGQLVPLSHASMSARVNPGVKYEDACVTPPASKYRGAENQFYRVEIHRGGTADEATFKWSRDNGSVATLVLGIEASDLQVSSARGFAAGDWVELSDNNTELLGQTGTLVQLVKVEGNTLSVDPALTVPPLNTYPVNAKVRRWNYAATDAISLSDDHAVPVQESPANATADQIVWIDLEDGVQIQFSNGGNYRTGDYWWFPARVATGNIEWPQTDDLNPQPLPPQGPEHHYALLGTITRAKDQWNLVDLRCEFWPIFFCLPRPVIETAARVAAGPIQDMTPPAKTAVRPAGTSATQTTPVVATSPQTTVRPAGTAETQITPIRQSSVTTVRPTTTSTTKTTRARKATKKRTTKAEPES